MQIVGAFFPPTVDISRLQQRVSSVGLQPTPETGRAPPIVRPELTPTTSIQSTPAVPQSGTNRTALQRQLFEFGLRIVTGAFSRLVTDILGLTPPGTAASPITEKPTVDNRSEPVLLTVNTSTLQSPAIAPIPVVASAPANQPEAKEIVLQTLTQSTPVATRTPSTINPKDIQGAVVPPFVPAQAPAVTPIPSIIAAVSEITRSAPLDQHSRRRIDIFDVQNASTGMHAKTGSRLDVIA